jgi:mannan endo-1,4-beta-mannosidase
MSSNAQLIDRKATSETKALYKNLKKLQQKGVMFGHQDASAYGVGWKNGDGKRSDIYDVVNDYPAVYGWDLGDIEHRSENNLDSVPFSKMKHYIKDAYDRGGINTLSWHVDNPATLGTAWDNSPAVPSILPGGKNHKMFTKWLDGVAEFMADLRGSDGKRIPILFRPYHELNGNWFWWGTASCTAPEYIALWKFTVHYLMDVKKIHHLIYVYNTNDFKNSSEFLARYPGDKFADMVSFDAYQLSKPNATEMEIKSESRKFNKELKKSLSILDSVAKAHNKVPALAEVGYEAIPDETWWTEMLADALKDYSMSYVLLWRNHGWHENDKKMHYYVPYTGHKSEVDFRKFYQLPFTLFGSDVAKQKVYKK